jgi:hypothetical protein
MYQLLSGVEISSNRYKKW